MTTKEKAVSGTKDRGLRRKQPCPHLLSDARPQDWRQSSTVLLGQRLPCTLGTKYAWEHVESCVCVRHVCAAAPVTMGVRGPPAPTLTPWLGEGPAGRPCPPQGPGQAGLTTYPPWA